MDKVKKVLVKLSTDYLKSPQVNYRNGALSAIASIAVALGSCFVDYFPIILEPVLKCLEDSDSKVRYYASESLYNIAKAVHSGILPYFDQFLYAACQLFADNDTYVKKISFFYSSYFYFIFLYFSRWFFVRSCFKRYHFGMSRSECFEVYSYSKTIHLA